MHNSSINVMEISHKQFLKLAYGFLVIAFILMMVQNVIRYGAYESYRPLRSLLYLINSVLLFIPLLPINIWGAKHLFSKTKSLFMFGGLLLVGLSIICFYLFSSLSLFLFGYYEEILSSEYARNYFSREVLLHLIVLGSSLIFVWYHKEKESEERFISGSLGRKKVRLSLASVLWISADDHYLHIHSQEMNLIKRSTMKEMEQKLAPDFIRIHRKYLVNRNKITTHIRDKRSDFLILTSGKQLKVGSSYKHNLKHLDFHDK